MATKERPYVNLHNHTDFSLLDGAQTTSEMAEASKGLGHSHIAITDHGTMRGFYKFHLACEQAEIAPIYGMEAYMCMDRHRRGLTKEEKASAVLGMGTTTSKKIAIKEAEATSKVRERFHTCLFAKNDIGLKNLFRISSVGWLEGFYYRPRIDMEVLEKYSEGVILSTACTSGILATPFMQGDLDRVWDSINHLQEIFGDDLYLEIMPHDFEEQVKVNLATVKIGQALGIQIIATNDAHYARKKDYLRHEVSLCMQTKDVWSNPKRWKFTGTGFYLRSREEMADEFRTEHPGILRTVVDEALDNTYELARLCEASVHIDRKKCLLPPVEVPDRHLHDFMEWASEAYPEHYKLMGHEHDLPSVPCCLDGEAPSAADEVVG